MIIDDDGIYYGIGVILDGNACKHSNIGRGARYNSAYTFITNQLDFDSENEWKNKNERYMAVVVSEDKTVDIITNRDIVTPFIEDLNEEARLYGAVFDDGMD